MAIEVDALWDFSNPALSEERFQAAATDAETSDRLILTTQIARTHGLRGDFTKAREILESISQQIGGATPEVQARFHLELGRTHASAANNPDEISDSDREQAAKAYNEAASIAEAAQLPGLQIDAIHMLSIIETNPRRQEQLDRSALEIATTSRDPLAQKWEASIRNNLGCNLHSQGRYPEALEQFQIALKLRVQRGDPVPIRIANWMIAWTLRHMERYQDALEIQLELEREWEIAGTPDPYVYQELAELYTALGDQEAADRYTAKQKLTS